MITVALFVLSDGVLILTFWRPISASAHALVRCLLTGDVENGPGNSDLLTKVPIHDRYVSYLINDNFLRIEASVRIRPAAQPQDFCCLMAASTSIPGS